MTAWKPKVIKELVSSVVSLPQMGKIPYIPIYYYWIGWVVNDRVKGLPAAEDLRSVDPTYYVGWFAERLSIQE